MAYRLRYTVNVDWVPPGVGPMSGLVTGRSVSGGVTTDLSPGGGASLFTFEVNQTPVAGAIISGTGTGGAIASADITALLTALTTDVSAQLNANIARLQQWPKGGALAQ